MSEHNVILDVQNLRTYFPIKGGVVRKTVGYVHAVENVSFQIREQETFGLVGESGCGKSTTGRTILRLIEPTAGQVLFDGEDLCTLDREAMRQKRRDMQLVFQDPYASLNPRMTVRKLLEEPLRTHFRLAQAELDQQVSWIAGAVGLAEEQLERYPHQFSGGQRQRISIARALITKPRFVVADEPVSALDVSIQAQILNLLMNLQKDLKLSYLFISHDLNVVRHISNRVGVMYLGRIVELGDTEDVYCRPMHPYTQALLSAIPKKDPAEKKVRIRLEGDVPNPASPPPGCAFHNRCPHCMDLWAEGLGVPNGQVQRVRGDRDASDLRVCGFLHSDRTGIDAIACLGGDDGGAFRFGGDGAAVIHGGDVCVVAAPFDVYLLGSSDQSLGIADFQGEFCLLNDILALGGECGGHQACNQGQRQNCGQKTGQFFRFHRNGSFQTPVIGRRIYHSYIYNDYRRKNMTNGFQLLKKS